MQVRDSDEQNVVLTFARTVHDAEDGATRALALRVVVFQTMASAIGQFCRSGHIVVLDEFQYFTRHTLDAFASHLQAEVDRLRDTK